MAVRKYSYARDVTAGCFDCKGTDYIWHSPNAQAVAARHHDATGHTTWVEVYMNLTYGRRKSELLER